MVKTKDTGPIPSSLWGFLWMPTVFLLLLMFIQEIKMNRHL